MWPTRSWGAVHDVPRRWTWPAVAVAATVVLVCRAGSAVTTFSSTVDEPYHIGSAVALYQAHAHVMGVQHGPLPRLVAGLPLWLAGVRQPLPGGDPLRIWADPAAFTYGGWVLFHGPVPYWRVLTLARWAMLLTFPPLCLLYTYLLGRRLGGPRVGALATVFASLDPTLMGHAFWVCTDMAATAGLLAALYHGLAWLAVPTWGRTVAAGAAVGACVSCKFSGGLIVPALFALAVLGVGRRVRTAAEAGHRSGRPTPFAWAGRWAVMGMTAALALWATYLFAFYPVGPNDAGTQPMGLAAHVPVPMPSLWVGLQILQSHVRNGHPTYLDGQRSTFGWHRYFPEALAMKEPLSALAAVAAAAVALALVPAARRRWAPALAVLVPAGLLLAVAIAGHLDLGVRHVLPCLPCLYLFACLELSALRWGGVALAGLIVTAAVETAPVQPDYLSYFNVLAGGPSRGDRHLLDSNLDWGQDGARLTAYLRSPAAAGRRYTLRLFDLQPRPLAAALGLRPAAATDPPAGLFAVSKTIRHRVYDYLDVKDGDFGWLAPYPVVAHVGYGIDVYDLDRPATRPAVGRPDRPD